MRSCSQFSVILCCSLCIVEYTLFDQVLSVCGKDPHPSLFLISIKFIFISDKKKISESALLSF